MVRGLVATTASMSRSCPSGSRMGPVQSLRLREFVETHVHELKMTGLMKFADEGEDESTDEDLFGADEDTDEFEDEDEEGTYVFSVPWLKNAGTTDSP